MTGQYGEGHDEPGDARAGSRDELHVTLRGAWDTTAHGPVRGPARIPDRVPAPSAVQLGYNRGAIPLLDLITRQSLDEDYLHVAERDAAAGPRPQTERGRRRPRLSLTIAVGAVFGLLVTVAAVQTSRNASVDTESKDQLIARINVRRDAVAALQRQIADLRTTNTAAEGVNGSLGDDLSTIGASQRTLLAATGWGEVRGAGVRAVIDDAPSGNALGQVRDSDLAGLVNGLWQAGATAISVDGQRLTTLSSIRNSGSVVRVNDVSLSPPYTVLAVGDTGTLQARFAQTTSGTRLRAVARQYGMSFTMHNVTSLTVPAAPSSILTLRHTRAVGDASNNPMSKKETP